MHRLEKVFKVIKDFSERGEVEGLFTLLGEKKQGGGGSVALTPGGFRGQDWIWRGGGAAILKKLGGEKGEKKSYPRG